jgi:RNA polymerase sigma factor (sigma-70 family)
MAEQPGAVYLRSRSPSWRPRRRFGGGRALRGDSQDSLDEKALSAWLGGVARRDTDALAVLYGQTSPRLLAVLLRILRRREIAEEVLHDVYLRVWDRAASYDPSKGSAMGWLVSVARNAALDHFRRHRREVLGADDREAEDAAVELADPQDFAQASAARRALQACLERLDPEPRRCLVLAYQRGLTYEEMARQLDRPVNTLKSWVRRSLVRLRHCLEGQ